MRYVIAHVVIAPAVIVKQHENEQEKEKEKDSKPKCFYISLNDIYNWIKLKCHC